jgi:hypothetical protein
MAIQMKFIAPLLAAGAVAAAIAAAPAAFAADHQTCNASGSGPSASRPATFSSTHLRHTSNFTPTAIRPISSSTTSRRRLHRYHVHNE